MAIAFVFGRLFSTVLTLGVVPILDVLFFRVSFRDWVASGIGFDARPTEDAGRPPTGSPALMRPSFAPLTGDQSTTTRARK